VEICECKASDLGRTSSYVSIVCPPDIFITSLILLADTVASTIPLTTHGNIFIGNIRPFSSARAVNVLAGDNSTSRRTTAEKVAHGTRIGKVAQRNTHIASMYFLVAKYFTSIIRSLRTVIGKDSCKKTEIF